MAPDSEPGPLLAAVERFHHGFPDLAAPTGPSSELWSIHAGGRSTIYGARVAGETFCLKVFTDRRTQSRIRTALGWSKGRRAFRNGLRAREAGIPVPLVYAYAEKKPFGPTLVAMELLTDATQMNLWIEEKLAQGVELTTDPSFGQLIRAFARFTQDLHARGVCHNDFSPRNVLVIEGDGGPRLQLIDLEDIVFTGDRRKFRFNVEHFSSKMARYVNPAALAVFLRSFNEVYKEELTR